MSDYSLIYSVFSNVEQAKMVAKILLSEKLIACANVLPAHTAIYEWQGKICEESESILLAKTISQNFAAVEKRICELHSYSLPCVLQVDVAAGNSEFLKWIRNSTKDAINS